MHKDYHKSFVSSEFVLTYSNLKNLPAMRETWVQSLGWGKISWRRESPPTPVFWPGEFQGLYSPWGCKQLDTTERLSLTHSNLFQITVAIITKVNIVLSSSWGDKTYIYCFTTRWKVSGILREPGIKLCSGWAGKIALMEI